MKAVTAEAMSEIDRAAQIEYNISGTALMENAGLALAENVLSNLSDVDGYNIAVVCGKGNNGGDGFVAARYIYLAEPDCNMTIFAPDISSIKSPDAKRNFSLLKDLGPEILDLAEFSPTGFTVVIDAIFGTGFREELPSGISSICKRINSSAAMIFSADVPTGLDSTEGTADANCIISDHTITFGLPKTGFYKNAGPMKTGNIVVVDIGFPDELLKRYQEL